MGEIQFQSSIIYIFFSSSNIIFQNPNNINITAPLTPGWPLETTKNELHQHELHQHIVCEERFLGFSDTSSHPGIHIFGRWENLELRTPQVGEAPATLNIYFMYLSGDLWWWGEGCSRFHQFPELLGSVQELFQLLGLPVIEERENRTRPHKSYQNHFYNIWFMIWKHTAFDSFAYHQVIHAFEEMFIHWFRCDLSSIPKIVLVGIIFCEWKHHATWLESFSWSFLTLVMSSLPAMASNIHNHQDFKKVILWVLSRYCLEATCESLKMEGNNMITNFCWYLFHLKIFPKSNPCFSISKKKSYIIYHISCTYIQWLKHDMVHIYITI